MTGLVSLLVVLRLWVVVLMRDGEGLDLEHRRARARYLLLRYGWRRHGLAGRTRLVWQLVRWQGPARSARWRVTSACAAGIAGTVTFLDDRRRLAEMEKRPWYTSTPVAIVALIGQPLGTVVVAAMFRTSRPVGLGARALAALAALAASVTLGLIGVESIRLSLLPAERLRQEHENAEAWRRRMERQQKRRKRPQERRS